jgi:hypothetical protein
MDSDVVKDSKCYQKEAKEESEARVQTIAKPIKVIFQLVFVTSQNNYVESIG